MDVTLPQIVPSPLTEAFGAPEDPPIVVATQNLLLTAELLLVARAFGRAGVPFIVLKGVPLAHRIFGRLHGRRIRDNDILVRPHDVDRALGVLRDCGYESASPPPRELRRENQHTMMRRLPLQRVVRLELHWRAFYPPLFDVPEEIEWRHIQPFPLNDVVVQVFDEPLTLLHLTAHFAQHALSEAWILRDVATAWNVWHSNLDHDELRTLARGTGTARVLDFALAAATDLSLLVAPAPWAASRQVALLRWLLPTERLFEPRPSPDHRRRMLLFLLTGLGRVPGYVRYGMFPTLETMSVTYNKPVSRWLYVRYATRPLRALRRALRLRPRT